MFYGLLLILHLPLSASKGHYLIQGHALAYCNVFVITKYDFETCEWNILSVWYVHTIKEFSLTLQWILKRFSE